jgi:cytochrome c oxidase subunit 2
MSRILRFLSVFSIVLALGISYAIAADAPAAPAAAPAVAPVANEAAIAAADAITAYDPAKVVGQAKPWDYNFQPAESPTMKSIKSLHDFVFIIITVITIFVLGLLVYICLRFNARANPVARKFSHNTLIEIIWTAVPIIILVAIGVPSIRAHYAYTYNQEIIDHPDVTLKIVGHQWYWSYEYPDQGIAFDSNIKKDPELVNGEPRLLTVDNPIVVPVDKVVRVQMTSADVIHAWALPSFGIKRDAVPGRLNETWFKAEKEGIYYGQCSELCGKFHGFMPIQIHVVSEEQFNIWVAGAKLKYADSGHIQLAVNQ